MSTNNNQNETNKPNKKRTGKQIIALAGVILLALLYVVTFVLAIVDNSASGQLFMTCFVATALLPMILWIYTWIFGKFTGKKTIADFHPEEETEENMGEYASDADAENIADNSISDEDTPDDTE